MVIRGAARAYPLRCKYIGRVVVALGEKPLASLVDIDAMLAGTAGTRFATDVDGVLLAKPEANQGSV